MKMVRLDKFLSDSAIYSRSEAKILIKKGFVAINGTKADRGETKIDIEKDQVLVKGKLMGYSQFEYYMLNKPAGVVSATQDNVNETVIELVPKPHAKDIFPVGRLDKDTEGLLLITNDGELSHDLLSPKKHVDKTYFVRVKGTISESDAKALENGVDIGEESITLPAKVKILSTGEVSEAELTIHEGKFHQVKRMFKAVDKEVIYLKRLSMGSLLLDETLKYGECRRLTEEEINNLRNNM